MENDAKWDVMVNEFIAEYKFTNQTSKKEVIKKVKSFLRKKYPNVPKANIEFITNDITESICIKLKINDD